MNIRHSQPGAVMLSNQRLKTHRQEIIAGLLFASPWIVGFLLFTLYPMVASLYYGFTDYNSFVVTRTGLFNYAQIFRDEFVISSFKNTLLFVVINVPMSTVLGILFGMLLTRKTFGQKMYRTIFYLPAVISVMASAFLWQWLFDADSGPINGFLGYFGITGPDWLNDPAWVKPAFLLQSAWGVGGTIILYLAAISNVPADQYEAAEIDGAGGLVKFFRITLPNISSIISFNVLMGLIGAFQYFLPPFILTNGGPGFASYFLGQVIYVNAFAQKNMGYASAVSWMVMAMIFCCTLIYLKLSKRFVNYA